jgi:hypothetical protein
MRRPFGVWIIAILAIAAGVLYLAGGLNLMGAVMFGPARSGTGVWFTGLMSVIAGLVYIVAGFSLWSLRPWALAFTMFMGVVGLLGAGWALLLTGDLAYGLAQAILPGFLLWYANRTEIQDAFGF